MNVLVICEKGNAARRIAGILSEGNPKQKRYGRVTVYSFSRNGVSYNVIGLRGHIIAMDFDKNLNSWSSVPPHELIRAEPVKRITENSIVSVLRKLAESADEIIIATDYDREGELIGVEAIEASGSGEKDRKKIKRARFSSLTKHEILEAFENLGDVNYPLAKSAEARQVVDLTWGAVLTRLISLAAGQKGKNFLSAGRVQSPTLSLIVDRDREIREFVPQPYWIVQAELKKEQTFFAHHRDQPFKKRDEADTAFNRAMKAKWARVVEFTAEEKKDRPPAPFDTTTFLMEASKLGIARHRP